MHLRLILILFLFLLGIPIFGQTDEQMLRLITGSASADPTLSSSPNDEKKLAILRAKNRLLGKSIDTLPDREVDDLLVSLGLTREGSLFSRRKRLRSALEEALPVTADPLANLPQSKKALPISIENASEGELLQVDKNKSGVLVLRGRVRLKLRSGSIEAETITVDSERQEIYAEGGIIYKDGRAIVEGDKFIYDFRLEKGVVYKTKGTFAPAHFIGEKLKKLDDKRYALEMGYFTICNAEKPHYSFKVNRLYIYDDKTVMATNVRYQVGGTTVLWLPFLYNSNLGNGWITQAGKNNTQGLFLQNSYQWSVMPTIAVAPMGYKVRADFYEKTGQAVQLEMWKQSPLLNYLIDIGYANHRNYTISGAYEDRFHNFGIGTTAVTNQVDKGALFPYDPSSPYRKIGQDVEPWWKGRILLNSKMNNTEKDVTRNFSFQYENYSNRLFDYEYGNRYEPSNTLQSLYTARNVRQGYIRNTLEWKFDYTENRGDLSINVGMKRNLLYYILSPTDKSGYFPTIDVLPTTTIRNSSEIGRLPYFNSAVYWDAYLNNTILRYYGVPTRENLGIPTLDGNYQDPYGNYKENVLRTQYFTQGETGLRTNLNFGSYVSFTPNAFFGGKKQSATVRNNASVTGVTDNSFTSLERYLARESYGYIRTASNLRIGIPLIFLNATYRKLEAYKPELQDPILAKTRQHELEVSLESYAFENFEISIRTIRDLRSFSPDYQPQPTNQERWYFTVARFSGYFDFLDGLRPKRASLLEKKRSFYSGLFINNDYVHHTPKAKPLSNSFTASYKMGGFTLPFVRLIRELELGGTWYHVYNSPILDGYRIFVKANVDFTRHLGIEAELDSRVSQPWRYTNQVGNTYDTFFYGNDPTISASTLNLERTTLQRDLLDGTGVNGNGAKQNTALNINRFMGTIKYNLHTANFRLGYSMDLRAVPGGRTDGLVSFYDQSVFFSISITDFSLGQQDSSELTRVRLFRFRKRPFQAGDRAGISSENP
ncbi:LPS-assembly protein LptD [Leptospira sp. 201903070]|uniref:LPS-assembly protein LptD n=1 Tax=Leptospira ainlahdjerensis TaxID=2810033 RepID=A0ABS2UF90_9LEPT|nr:LPS-assembly protein LptD [Leptospira ainlahdjerensis]MBM9578449.1 LPS-assembly protein LptD [Leptospira ainlahdjerensis]